MPVINERKLGLGPYAVSTKGITIAGITKYYDNIAERDADASPGTFAYVKDASADPTVNAGFAIYTRKSGVWEKIFEQEAMDRDESELYHVDWSKIVNGPAATPTQIDDAVRAAHSHVNQDVLDSLRFSGKQLTNADGEAIQAAPSHYTKWMQLIRPINATNDLHCLIHFYQLSDTPETPGWQLVRSVDSRIADTDQEKNQGKFYYYNGSQFINVTNTGFPANISGRFVIVDVADIVKDGTLFISWEWLDGETQIANGMCVYPAITPTNTDSVGLTSMIEQTNWNTIS